MNNSFNRNYPTEENKNNNIRWFIFYEDNLLILNNEGKNNPIPLSTDLVEIQHLLSNSDYLGQYNDQKCCYGIFADKPELPGNLQLVNLRMSFQILDETQFQIAGYGYQMAHWDITTQYCGKCGSKNTRDKKERSKKCVSCHTQIFPRISPAVIVAVIKDNSILLARNQRFKSGIYSVLAGFVEPGESLEECIMREIREEVSIEVNNISYFGSQPWPYPDALMIAFIADYKSGEIKVDKKELIDARWYNSANLPDLPLKFSIARRMIDWYIEEYPVDKIKKL